MLTHIGVWVKIKINTNKQNSGKDDRHISKNANVLFPSGIDELGVQTITKKINKRKLGSLAPYPRPSADQCLRVNISLTSRRAIRETSFH